MKKVILTLLLFLYCLLGHATVCADMYFIEKHISICVCKNHGRGLDNINLYYKGVAKALNKYIALRIERGELKNKRFDIYMFDPIITRPHISLTQGSKGYYILTGEAKSLNELIRLIDEFAQPNFKGLDIGLWDHEDYEENERLLKRIEKRILNKEIPQNDLELILDKNQFILWKKNDMKVVFHQDKVKCFIDNKEINHSLLGYPQVIQDRYILQNKDGFTIYQDTILIKIFKYKSDDWWDSNEYLQSEIYAKWANFSSNDITYSYSYDQNRFYAIE